MKSEGNGIYSYDLGEKDIELKSDHQYAVNFAAGDRWSVQTCDLLIGEPCFGHTASCTGKLVENNIDSNKKNNEVFWDNGVDQSKYAPPLIITSIGNVIGNVPIKPQYDMMVQFLSEMLTNAREYANKNDQQLIDDVASALGIGAQKNQACPAAAQAAATAAATAAQAQIPVRAAILPPEAAETALRQRTTPEQAEPEQ